MMFKRLWKMLNPSLCCDGFHCQTKDTCVHHLCSREGVSHIHKNACNLTSIGVYEPIDQTRKLVASAPQTPGTVD